MSPRPLTIDVDGRDVVFTDPSMARAAGRRWNRMARDVPDDKARELRQRAKAAHDWARRVEDAQPAQTPQTEPEPKQEPPAESPASPSRRRAAAALAESGITRTRRASSTARRRGGRAVRRYERAGGVEVSSAGQFAVYFFGTIVALVLLEDALSARGSTSLAGAATVATAAVHRVVSPVPIVNAPTGG